MDRRISNLRIIVLIILMHIFIAGFIYGIVSNRITFNNVLKTSSVDIALSQYAVNSKGVEEVLHESEVFPGQKVSYIPRVRNNGAECYVRVGFEIEMDRNDIENVTLDNALKIGAYWKKIGSMFYYTKPLKNGEIRDVFEGFVIPKSWNREFSSGFKIIAYADAIQAVNVSPDFESISPWGSIGITEQSRDNEKNINIYSVKKIKDATILIKDNSKIECTTSDLFEDFDSFMPGDTYEKEVLIKNESGSKVNVFFRTDNEDDKLLELIKLSITSEKQNLFEGTLSTNELRDFKKLMSIDSGEERKLNFRVIMPEYADNQFSSLSNSVKWIIKAEREEHNIFDRDKRIIRTGDMSQNATVFMTIICIVMAIMLAFIFIIGRRSKNRYGNKNN